MSLVNPYCTVAQVQDELRNDKDTVESLIEDAINQASRWVDAYMGRDFYQHDCTSSALVITKYNDAVFEHELFLPYRPIIGDLTSVTVCGTEWVEDEDFYVLNGCRLIAIDGVWDVGAPPDDTIEIVGKFGYAQTLSSDIPTGMPEEIKRATVLVAAAFSGHNRKEIVGLDGTKEEVIDKAIPKTVFDILGHRRTVIV